MQLRILNKAELKHVYQTHMKRAFPPAELKPLRSMESMRTRGAYEPLGMFDGEELVGYAMMWLEPGVPFALLDYLGTVEGKRNHGLGAALLGLLAEHYASYRGIFGESEGVTSSDPEQAELQRRRLEFYHRNGFRYGGYDCALFGVHYQTLIRGDEDVTSEELLQVHEVFYRKQIPALLYDRFVQIPLQPGEKPNPAVDWREE